MTPVQRWQELKDYLAAEIGKDAGLAGQEPIPPVARTLAARLSANRATLAKMDELEAGQ